MNHPFIVIPTNEHENKGRPALFALRTYTEAVERAGGIPLLIARPNREEQKEIIALADGLLLAGGDDIDPRHYGETNHACREINEERDMLELELIHLAQTKQIPILGICRGMQVLNVALGGTLYQDVVAEMAGAARHDYHKDESGNRLPYNQYVHSIQTTPDTLLATLLGAGKHEVNSLHHQGIKGLGKGLRASAHAPDGLIEAIELPDHPFFLGVEWHPEELGDEPSQKIFAAFIAATQTKK